MTDKLISTKYEYEHIEYSKKELEIQEKLLQYEMNAINLGIKSSLLIKED